MTFYWEQTFPAGGVVEVEHIYRPMAGGNADPSDNMGIAKQGYCAGAKDLERLAVLIRRSQKQTKNYYAVMRHEVEFVLRTGNNWNGPIRHFHLTVAAPPGGMMLTCAEMRKTGPGTYEMKRKKFSPQRDLSFAFFRPPRHR